MKDGSFVVLFKDDSKKEVFLVLRSDYHIWVLTGGGIEKGEKPEKAAIREAKEESGFRVKILRKAGVYEFFNPPSRNSPIVRSKYAQTLFRFGRIFPPLRDPAVAVTALTKRMFEISQPQGRGSFNKQKELIRRTHLYEGRRISGEYKPEYPGCKGKWFDVSKLPLETMFRTKQKIRDTKESQGEPFLKAIREVETLRDLPIFLRHPFASFHFLALKYLRK